MGGRDRIGQYYDSEGEPTTLEALCRKEPEWAANRLRHEKDVRTEVLVSLLAWRTSFPPKKKDIERLLDKVEPYWRDT